MTLSLVFGQIQYSLTLGCLTSFVLFYHSLLFPFTNCTASNLLKWFRIIQFVIIQHISGKIKSYSLSKIIKSEDGLITQVSLLILPLAKTSTKIPINWLSKQTFSLSRSLNVNCIFSYTHHYRNRRTNQNSPPSSAPNRRVIYFVWFCWF